MAKEKNENILIAALLFLSLVIFASAFVAGYFYGDELTSIVGPRLNQENVVEKSEEGVPEKESSETLPEGFPESFPVHGNAVLVDSWTASGNSTQGISVNWETDDTVEEVALFYEEALKKEAWTISNKFEEEGTTTITFEKEEASGFVGITSGESGKTLISVTMGIGS